jgi:hypothetical protein
MMGCDLWDAIYANKKEANPGDLPFSDAYYPLSILASRS